MALARALIDSAALRNGVIAAEDMFKSCRLCSSVSAIAAATSTLNLIVINNATKTTMTLNLHPYVDVQ